MTIIQAEKKIRNAWIVGLISGLTTLIFTLAAATSQDGTIDLAGTIVTVWYLIDVGLIFLFAFGIYIKSRVAAVGMFIYFLVSKLMMWGAAFSSGASLISLGILIGAVCLYFYFEGARGAIIYHRLRSGKELIVDPMSVTRLRKRAWATVILAGIVVATVVVASVMILNLSSGPHVGDCVAHGRGDELKAAACDSSQAFGRISKLNRQEVLIGFDEPDCPDDTDSFGRFDRKESTLSDVGCIRNLVPPHPGDPGGGGGILRAGDCIDSAVFLREVTCSAEASGHLVGLAATASNCPPATLDLITRNAGHRPVLCLDSGKDVLAPGDCIADPSRSIFGSPKVSCDSVNRTAMVVARAQTAGGCPSATRSTLASKSGTVDTRVVCLQ
jgi:hypothetical protein